MEFNNINELLDKYWVGATSLQEEQTLQSYFQQDQIAEEHRQFAPLFQYFVAEKEPQLSDDFDQRLLQQLEELEGEERPVVSLKRGTIRRIRTYAAGVAAAIALLLSVWFLFPKTADPAIAILSQQEVEEAKIAYQQAKAALLVLSTKMNKGTQAAVSGLNELDKATEVVSGN